MDRFHHNKSIIDRLPGVKKLVLFWSARTWPDPTIGLDLGRVRSNLIFCVQILGRIELGRVSSKKIQLIPRLSFASSRSPDHILIGSGQVRLSRSVGLDLFGRTAHDQI